MQKLQKKDADRELGTIFNLGSYNKFPRMVILVIWVRPEEC